MAERAGVGRLVVPTILRTGLHRGEAEPAMASLLGRAPRSLRAYVEDHAELWAGADGPSTWTPRSKRG